MDPDVTERVNSAIRRVLAESEVVVTATNTHGVLAQRRLLRLLEDADLLLSRRLAEWLRITGSPERFTAASLQVYQSQIRMMVAQVRNGLQGITTAQSANAWATGMTQVQKDLTRLETAFTGIARTPRLQEAMRFDSSNGRASSLLRSIDTSCDRYGESLIGEYERRLQLGMVAGFSNQEMVELLTSHGGPTGEVSLRARVVNGQVVRTATEQIPEGLFIRYRSWAWRIVRTESANAYNGARMERMQSMSDDYPEMQKKIIAHFDNRTAPDSIAVHGQIRDVSGPNSMFVDGAGRIYEHPPARPNDRETVLPWITGEWEETSVTRPLTAEEQETRIARAKKNEREADRRRESPEYQRARALVDQLSARRRAAGAGSL